MSQFTDLMTDAIMKERVDSIKALSETSIKIDENDRNLFRVLMVPRKQSHLNRTSSFHSNQQRASRSLS